MVYKILEAHGGTLPADVHLFFQNTGKEREETLVFIDQIAKRWNVNIVWVEWCRDDIVSPYLIHRRPDRKKQKQAQTKDHWTQVEERYLTRAFKESREAASCYKGWKEEEMPGFHKVRALSLHLYQKAGKDGQKIAGHASETMTKNYQKDHAEIVWSEAIPDLNISEITG